MAPRSLSPSIAGSPASARPLASELGLRVDRHRSSRIQGNAARCRSAGPPAPARNELPVWPSIRSSGRVQAGLGAVQRACGGPKVTECFRDYLLDAVSLAALGVVADVVPLLGENRILVHHGLKRLRQTPLIGLKALYQEAGLGSGESLRASDIGYSLAPRMNAAGRLGCARLVVELLTTGKRDQAADWARCLEDQNGKRQVLERRILAEARTLVETNNYHETAAIVLASSGGTPASLALSPAGSPMCTADRLCWWPSRPGRCASEALPIGVGSGRSIAGFALSRSPARLYRFTHRPRRPRDGRWLPSPPGELGRFPRTPVRTHGQILSRRRSSPLRR